MKTKREYTIEETKANLEVAKAEFLKIQRRIEFLTKIVYEHDVKEMRAMVRKELEEERAKKGAG